LGYVLRNIKETIVSVSILSMYISNNKTNLKRWSCLPKFTPQPLVVQINSLVVGLAFEIVQLT